VSDNRFLRCDDAYNSSYPEPVGDNYVDNVNVCQGTYNFHPINYLNYVSNCNLDDLERVGLTIDICCNSACSHSGGYYTNRTFEHKHFADADHSGTYVAGTYSSDIFVYRCGEDTGSSGTFDELG
jgi:hypothetical protein